MFDHVRQHRYAPILPRRAQARPNGQSAEASEHIGHRPYGFRPSHRPSSASAQGSTRLLHPANACTWARVRVCRRYGDAGTAAVLLGRAELRWSLQASSKLRTTCTCTYDVYVRRVRVLRSYACACTCACVRTTCACVLPCVCERERVLQGELGRPSRAGAPLVRRADLGSISGPILGRRSRPVSTQSDLMLR